MSKKIVETPLMKQYFEMKALHPDAVLLFRVGDFYETYGEDAVTASQILGITLTRRANGVAQHVEMAGFPHHAVDTYLPKLIRAGKRVAICEQLEDPKLTKKLVKRGITELVTPGVATTDNVLLSGQNNFLAAVHFGRSATGVAFLDISTGEFLTAEGDTAYIDKLLANMAPKEVLVMRGCKRRLEEEMTARYLAFELDDWVFTLEAADERLRRQFSTASLKGFGIDQFTGGVSAAGAILHYLEFTEHRDIAHIKSIARLDQEDFVWIDKFTIRNLELFASNGAREKGSFAEAIDRTLTPMGGRMLKRWIAMPIKNPMAINERLDIVEYFTQQADFSETVRAQVTLIGDLERIASRIAAAKVTPRELVQLKNSLTAIEELKRLLEQADQPRMRGLSRQLDTLAEVRDRIAREIYPDPQNNQIQKGGVIADGVDPELDDLRRIALHGKDYLAKIQQRESEATGIPSLRLSYNNVFGYYIEARNTHKDRPLPTPNATSPKNSRNTRRRFLAPRRRCSCSNSASTTSLSAISARRSRRCRPAP